jgi:predicted ATPase
VPKPDAELGLALDRLIAAGLLFRQGVPPHATYLFKHALIQDAAYNTLLRSHRVQLHKRIAATLQQQFPEIVRERPEIVAQHCMEAGLVEQAINYWLAAGQRAFARCAMKEAVAQLRKGLDLVATMPEEPWCVRGEIRLQNALGVALAAAEGPVPQVALAHQRARELSRKVEEPEELYRAIFGLWLINHRRGEGGPAIERIAFDN